MVIINGAKAIGQEQETGCGLVEAGNQEAAVVGTGVVDIGSNVNQRKILSARIFAILNEAS